MAPYRTGPRAFNIYLYNKTHQIHRSRYSLSIFIPFRPSSSSLRIHFTYSFTGPRRPCTRACLYINKRDVNVFPVVPTYVRTFSRGSSFRVPFNCLEISYENGFDFCQTGGPARVQRAPAERVLFPTTNYLTKHPSIRAFLYCNVKPINSFFGLTSDFNFPIYLCTATPQRTPVQTRGRGKGSMGASLIIP